MEGLEPNLNEEQPEVKPENPALEVVEPEQQEK